MNPRVSKAEYISNHRLKLVFKNGEEGVFDFSKYLQYPVYQPLQDETFSKNVKVFNGVVCWDDTIDFDPDRLYLESEKV